jgi:hypothetical protein
MVVGDESAQRKKGRIAKPSPRIIHKLPRTKCDGKIRVGKARKVLDTLGGRLKQNREEEKLHK